MIDTTLMMVTYNRLNLTKETLDDLVNTVHRPYNLVIIDNGSTDGTIDYLNSLQDTENVKYNITLVNSNKGIAVGRNMALKKADELNTQWYCTIDNDVKMPNGWLDECINILIANKGFAAMGVNFEDTKYPVITKNGYSFQDKPHGNLGTACMVFTKQLHKMLGFFNTEYGIYGEEDADFGVRTRVLGFKIGYIERMGNHLGSGINDIGKYREFKTKQHNDNFPQFRKNCGLYSQKQKQLFIPYKEL
jgi:glycosyltransferase involved in cell wall biosynthesis